MSMLSKDTLLRILVSWRENLRGLLSYREILMYLLRKKGVRAAYNFLFCKLFVKEGEGGDGIAFAFIDPLLKLFPGLTAKLAPYPYNIEIEITTRCNKKCIICEHTYWSEESRDLTFNEFKWIVDQFPKLKWVNLTGEGDAFLNKDYLKMIKYLKSKDIPVYLVDSFDLIDEQIAKELVKMGVDGIYVSMDAATKETYEKIKVGCNFERTIANIKKLIEIKKQMKSPLPIICFRYIVTTLNVHEMPKFIELVHSLGGKDALGKNSSVEFASLLVFDEVKHLFVPKVPDEIWRETLEKARKLGVDVRYAHIGNLPPMEYCTAWLEPYIMMGGYVLPCCAVLQNNNRDFLRRYSFGNIFEKSFREIWYSERYRRFRRMIPDKKAKVPILCKGCRAFDTRRRERLYGVDKNT